MTKPSRDNKIVRRCTIFVCTVIVQWLIQEHWLLIKSHWLIVFISGIIKWILLALLSIVLTLVALVIFLLATLLYEEVKPFFSKRKK